jgi:hypothetical protein
MKASVLNCRASVSDAIKKRRFAETPYNSHATRLPLQKKEVRS